MNNDDLIMI